MSRGYPTIEEAEKIWLEGMEYRKTHFPHKHLSEDYIFHTRGVGEAARKIASKTPYLNPEKAYVLGLLHDCGKRIKEKEANRFHGQEGYDLMIEEGYPDVAKICLTHTFSKKDFSYDDFAYPKPWLEWAKAKLKDVEYDDYDRLIQLCDKFFEGTSMVSIEKRVEGIVRRYCLEENIKDLLVEESMILKRYFDKLCGKDIYNILGIKN